MAQTPDSEVLKAFGLVGEVVPISGGRGLCYRVDKTVLKPSEDDEEATWIAELSVRLPPSPHYQLAQPRQVVGKAGTYIHNGWTAASLLAGEVKPKPDFSKLLEISCIFHEDVRNLKLEKPAFMAQRSNRWREADYVTWEEKILDDVANVNFEMMVKFQSSLDRLEKIMRPLVPKLKQQIIHGDMTGNVLSDDKESPGIIDMTPYWRPAEYANAIIVADALAWCGEHEDLARRYAVDGTRKKLLARALYWRCLTFLIDTDLRWIESHLAQTNYRYAVDIVCSVCEESEE